jgi:hypothetical protein
MNLELRVIIYKMQIRLVNTKFIINIEVFMDHSLQRDPGYSASAFCKKKYVYLLLDLS